MRGSGRALVLRLPPFDLSTVHGGVIGPDCGVPRFRADGVPRVTDQSSVALYLRSVIKSRPASNRCVASVLRLSCERRVASEWVSARPTASALPRVSMRSVVASASQSSPGVVLAPAIQVWRRAAAANKSARIAKRLARLAVGRPKQVLQ
jgi:hypothetical protein